MRECKYLCSDRWIFVSNRLYQNREYWIYNMNMIKMEVLIKIMQDL